MNSKKIKKSYQIMENGIWNPYISRLNNLLKYNFLSDILKVFQWRIPGKEEDALSQT